MTIHTSSGWLKGSTPEDLEEYLLAVSRNDFPIDIFCLARCGCGSMHYEVMCDENAGVAMKTCSRCNTSSYICDSKQHWINANPYKWQCVECHSSTGNIGVGFSLNETSGDIQRLYLGIRCNHCGALGCYARREIVHSPSLHLLKQV